MIIAAICFGVVAVSSFTIMPLLVGAMIADLDLSAKQAGYVVAAEMAGNGLAALVVSVFIARLNRRLAAAFAVGLLIIGNLAAAVAGDLGTLLATRFVVGISSGTVMATVSAIFAGTRNPERNFSLFFTGNLLFGVIAFLTLPSLILVPWGLSGAYYLLAAVAAVVVVFLLGYLPKERAVAHGNKDSISSLLSTSAIFGLAGLLVYSVAMGALWPFVEQLGVARNLALNHIGFVLSATQFSGICGALLAAWLATRFGRRRPIAAGTVVLLSAMALYLFGMDLASYALASILFYFAFFFTLAYLMGALAVLDRAGRFAVLGVTMQTAGLALGPAIAGETITRSGYAGLIWLAAACLGLSFIFMMFGTRNSTGPRV